MNFSWLRRLNFLPAPARLTLTRAFSEQCHGLKCLENSRWNGMKHLTTQLNTGTNYIQVRNAGHSKWANIKNTKMSKDLQKSKETTKICQLMRLAIKEKGSADPKMNKALADAMEKGKEARVPNSTLMKVIDSIKNVKDLKLSTLYLKGPGKSVFIFGRYD